MAISTVLVDYPNIFFDVGESVPIIDIFSANYVLNVLSEHETPQLT